MVKTQIDIPEAAHEQLVRLARARGDSMAQVIRELICGGLAQEQRQDDSGKQVLQEIANIGATGGPTDLASNMNHYLYGAPRKTADE